MHKGNPADLEPDNWLKGSIKGTTIAWHGTDERALPYTDEPSNSPNLRAIPDYDEDDYRDHEDSEGRPMAEYGSAVGLHFGSLKSALDRSDTASRSYVHPVALPNSQVKVSKPWSDYEANYDEQSTDRVERGEVLPYRNEFEDKGSVSYRALPNVAKTWGETVLEAHDQHDGFSDRWGRRTTRPQGLPRPSTGQVAAAQAGYNPVVPVTANKVNDVKRAHQQPMFAAETFDMQTNRYVGHHVTERDADNFIAGHPDRFVDNGNPNVPNSASRLANEYAPPFWFREPGERHAALSKTQFMKTGHRE